MFSVVADVEMTYERRVEDLKTTHAVSRLISRLMDEQGLLITDVIERTGIPRPTISRHRNGHTLPKVDERRKYATCFRLDFEEFEKRWQAEAATARAIESHRDGITQALARIDEVLERIKSRPSRDRKSEQAKCDETVEPAITLAREQLMKLLAQYPASVTRDRSGHK